MGTLKFDRKRIFSAEGPSRAGKEAPLYLSGEHSSEGTWIALNESGPYYAAGARLKNLDEIHWLHDTLGALIAELEQK